MQGTQSKICPHQVTAIPFRSVKENEGAVSEWVVNALFGGPGLRFIVSSFL